MLFFRIWFFIQLDNIEKSDWYDVTMHAATRFSVEHSAEISLVIAIQTF